MSQSVEPPERLSFAGITIEVLADTETTGGAFTVLTEIPPLLDTPRHVHANEDELFIALEGEHTIEIGDAEVRLGPGQSVFAPRGVPHAQKRIAEGQGRMLLVCAPAGIEGFFRELSQAESDGTIGPDAYAAASERFGITWL